MPAAGHSRQGLPAAPEASEAAAATVAVLVAPEAGVPPEVRCVTPAELAELRARLGPAVRLLPDPHTVQAKLASRERHG